jgi:NAD(P)-dependent dehydrogenase (short-subunit alcohol dehydrogenase family)
LTTLAGQVAVVSGAGAGLGRSYALALAGEGAAIVVNDVDVESATSTVAEIIDAGGRAVVDSNRVGTPDAADAMVALAIDTFGRLDVMVTNAGADRRGPVLDLSPDDWDFTLGVHLAGSIHCSLAAARAMRDAGGCIINVTSAAFHAGTPTMAPYCVAKGGIFSLTRQLALELAPFGISVNAVSPPLTATAPALAFVDEMISMAQSADFAELLRASIEQPDQVAPIVVYLATEPGRRMSGRVFTLTAGALSSTTIETATVDRTGDISTPWSLDELDAAIASLD